MHSNGQFIKNLLFAIELQTLKNKLTKFYCSFAA